MFLKCSVRRKDGKEHRSWSIVESRRFPGGQVAQRHVLYLGEINDSQRAAWQKSIEVFDEHAGGSRQCALFPEDRTPPPGQTPAVQVRLDGLRLERPRMWGACWLGDQLWRELHLDTFFSACLGGSREGTDWEKILRLLTLYRLLSPGSEWRLHRHWFGTTALADLLAVDARAAQDDTLREYVVNANWQSQALLQHIRGRFFTEPSDFLEIGRVGWLATGNVLAINEGNSVWRLRARAWRLTCGGQKPAPCFSASHEPAVISTCRLPAVIGTRASSNSRRYFRWGG
jgi:hypothetical protein